MGKISESTWKFGKCGKKSFPIRKHINTQSSTRSSILNLNGSISAQAENSISMYSRKCSMWITRNSWFMSLVIIAASALARRFTCQKENWKCGSMILWEEAAIRNKSQNHILQQSHINFVYSDSHHQKISVPAKDAMLRFAGIIFCSLQVAHVFNNFVRSFSGCLKIYRIDIQWQKLDVPIIKSIPPTHIGTTEYDATVLPGFIFWNFRRNKIIDDDIETLHEFGSRRYWVRIKQMRFFGCHKEADGNNNICVCVCVK